MDMDDNQTNKYKKRFIQRRNFSFITPDDTGRYKGRTSKKVAK